MARRATFSHLESSSGEDENERSDASEEEEEEEGEEELDSDPAEITSPTRPKGKDKGKGKSKALPEDDPLSSHLIVQTAFDAYFTAHSTRAQTSSNIFLHLLVPLSAEEYSSALSTSSAPAPLEPPVPEELFARIMCELNEGLNVLCYGYGSKRRVLNRFASAYCAKRGHVVVGNGFHPEFALKDMLNAIERVPGVLSPDAPASASVEKQAQRIHEFFSQEKQKKPLYLIIHNIDSPALRSAKSKSLLSLLALTAHIHVIASIDHLHAPLLWSSSEASTRKGAGGGRGFAWVWHDLTTLAAYDFELAFADKASLSSAHGGGARKRVDAAAGQNALAGGMSETAALHILASVTQKAQKLFLLLGASQLQAIADAGDVGGAGDLQQYGIGYDAVFHMARDNFVATNDTALRALLGEFRDHGLVLSAQGGSGGGEVLWIPLRRERLTSVLGAVKEGQ